MPSARPNIVLITPDLLGADAVGCFGNDVVQTPHVDALAARGTRFTSVIPRDAHPRFPDLPDGWR